VRPDIDTRAGWKFCRRSPAAARLIMQRWRTSGTANAIEGPRLLPGMFFGHKIARVISPQALMATAIRCETFARLHFAAQCNHQADPTPRLGLYAHTTRGHD